MTIYGIRLYNPMKTLNKDKRIQNQRSKRGFPKPLWAVRQFVRTDSVPTMVEDICKHGVGHPNAEWLKAHPKECGLHGCCGCCYR